MREKTESFLFGIVDVVEADDSSDTLEFCGRYNIRPLFAARATGFRPFHQLVSAPKQGLADKNVQTKAVLNLLSLGLVLDDFVRFSEN